MAETQDEIIGLKKEVLYVKDQLGNTSGTTTIIKAGYRETVMVEEGPLIIQTKDMTGATLWDHPTQGIWDTSVWDGGPDAGTLSKYIRVINYNNRFNEHMRDNLFINTLSSTGTLNNSLIYYELKSGSTLNSLYIASDGTTRLWKSAKIALIHKTFVIDDCGTTTGWINNSQATAPTTTGEWYIDGNRSLGLGKSGITAEEFSYSKNITTTNLSGALVGLWINIVNENTFNDLKGSTTGSTTYIDLGTGTTVNANRYYLHDQLSFGENYVEIDVDNKDETIGTGATTSSIDWFKIGFTGTTTAGTIASNFIMMDRWIYKSKSDNIIITLSADGGSNWETTSDNTLFNFTNAGTQIMYRLTAGTTTRIERLFIEYSE